LGAAENFATFAGAPTGGLGRRELLWGAAAAASVAAVGVLTYAYLMPTYYRTTRGEVRLTPLSDGSTITLNTASVVAVRYTPLTRDVRLIEGEALFDVAKDSSRPFVVSAGGSRVRAVGTSFSVRRVGVEPTQVLVQEGIVDLFGGGPADDVPIRLPANTRGIAFDKPGPSGSAIKIALDPADVARRLAWRQGKIALEGITLAQAAAEFARYSETRIIIDDPSVARLTTTGLFSAHDPAGFARAAALTFGLQYGYTPDGMIKLWK
jgi:transmembrane sensor